MEEVVPCPECQQTEGYDPCGPYRVICMGCGAVLKNKEIESGETPNFKET